MNGKNVWFAFDSGIVEAGKERRPDLEDEIQKLIDRGVAVKGETIEELAAAMGADPEIAALVFQKYKNEEK
jgi:hypothetical protein